jgi:GR25 family glycosyltransferase involved in LPS biosynthesis
MKTYIIHYSRNNETLKEELLNKFPDAHIITQFDREDEFIPWIKYYTTSPLEMAMVSCNVKHYEALRDMVENDIEEAIIFEDDVVVIKDWKNKFMDIKNKYSPAQDYIKLGCLHRYNIDNLEHGAIVVGNNGGTEGQYVTKTFAKMVLQNLRVDNTIDLIHHACLKNRQIPCIPICSQTSIISNHDSYGHKYDMDMGHWKDYIVNYFDGKLYNYYELLKQYDIFKKKKKEVENAFYEKYNTNVDIKRIDYVYNNEFSK